MPRMAVAIACIVGGGGGGGVESYIAFSESLIAYEATKAFANRKMKTQ